MTIYALILLHIQGIAVVNILPLKGRYAPVDFVLSNDLFGTIELNGLGDDFDFY